MDLDGDGLTNGQELGDPCCLWRPGQAAESFSLGSRREYRRWDIFHPSSSDRDAQRLRAMREPLNCSEYDPKLYAQQFEAFYFRGADGPVLEVNLVPGKVIGLGILLGLLGHWFRNQGLAADVCPLLLRQRAVISTRTSLMVMLASFIYMDLTSGIVHLILDYAPSWLPGIGPLARGFQYHHFDPTAIIRISWYAYVSHVHLLCPLIAGLVLLSSASRVARLFWFWGAVFVHLFQTTHRWAHFQPKDLPDIVQYFQSSGLLLTHQRHMDHHQDLERQFTILSGHTDAILDTASRIVPPWRYDIWMLIGVCWLMLPVGIDLCCRGRLEALDSSAHDKHKVGIAKADEFHGA